MSQPTRSDFQRLGAYVSLGLVQSSAARVLELASEVENDLAHICRDLAGADHLRAIRAVAVVRVACQQLAALDLAPPRS